MRIPFIATAAVALCALTACTSPTPSPSETPSGSTGPAPTESVTSTPTPTAVPVATIPDTCDQPAMLRQMTKIGFPGAVDATPPWDPAKGTTLKLALDAGGRACGWAPPGADAGISAWWTNASPELWAKVGKVDTADELVATDIPGLDEDAAYFVYQPQDATHEFARWETDALFGTLWIHLGTSSWQTPEQGNAVFTTALKIAGLKP